jgi:hypothetical protein
MNPKLLTCLKLAVIPLTLFTPYLQSIRHMTVLFCTSPCGVRCVCHMSHM